jgi:transglutaminase-like putative cysteine protease
MIASDVMTALRGALLLSIGLLGSAAARAERAYAPGVAIERFVETHDVRRDGSDVETREMVVRIETDEGVESEGTQSVEFRKAVDVIESLQAWLIKPDGTRIVLPASSVKTQAEEAQEGASQFTDTYSKTIVYPMVEVGSRVGYKVRINHRTTVFPGLFLSSFALHRDFAYEHWQFNVNLPMGMPLYVQSRGILGGKIASHGGRDRYQFSYSRFKPSASEAGAISAMDIDDLLRVSTYPDMLAVGRAYHKTAAAYAHVTPAIKALAERLTQGVNEDRAKVAAIHHWVALNIRYVAVYIGHGGFVPHRASEVLAHHYGDCKDHAVLMEALLHAIGIESSAALVNAGDSYTLATVGTIDPTNHVITYVPSLDLYVDSTDPFSSFGQLSFEVSDKPTVLANLNRWGQTPRMQASDHRESAVVHLTIHADGTIEGSTSAAFSGMLEAAERGNHFQDRSSTEQTIVKNTLWRFNETGVGSLDFPDPSAIDQSFWLKSTYVLDPQTNFPGPGAMRVPIGLSPAGIELEAIDKPQASRSTAFICLSRTLEESAQIEFPASVVVGSIPTDVNYHSDGLDYEATYRLTDHIVFVHRQLIEQHPRNVCSPVDHAAWLAFHQVLQRDMRSQIFYQ